MTRKRKGRAVDGWLLVDKPLGVTSTQVVGRARWAFEAQKAGHAGTLDPLASGLLAVAFGEATKTVPYAQEGRKTYRFAARWGAATATDDLEGDVIATSDRRPSRDEIAAVLPQFVGEIMQAPPAYSAIKVDGARAYDLARKGEAVDLPPRPIMIHDLRLIATPDADTAEFEMICGKGGYVRSMARDLGAALGTCAHVVALRRVASGGFSLAGAIGWEALEALRDDPARDARLSPAATGLSDLPRLTVPAAVAARLRHGDAEAAALMDAPVYWVDDGAAPVAVIRNENGRAKIARVFKGA